ncbi:pseudouridine synthase [Paroceanicella profunda]|uniref:Pseudouridine synthase n=1 Tax=Paroceanicella profunda TaxID=2579971 RepID=A0A5B8FU82_9RHOB|nr:pseudouridine synthase [Paroceanicella profunda]QDL90660.1 pseudouridine synthase [Paroceanicella profunda]
MSDQTPEGERIAKRLARAGLASRREAERMIEAGRVRVNGKEIDSPALNVTARDRIEVDGKPVAAAEPTRMWRYYKPLGLVTSASDEKGRETVFDHLPEDMPRVVSVGRLDINSEGLLLLTNDGELKRRLELPSTGWLRKYRVRAKGYPSEELLEPLRKGITVDGERFQPMQVVIDRQQGANVWLTLGLREGRNREIRRALAEVGLDVNRLIRISYGPFMLGDLADGAVEEVRPKVLRDQLGLKGEILEEAPVAAPGGRAKAKPRGRAADPSGPGGTGALRRTGAPSKPAPSGRSGPGGQPGPARAAAEKAPSGRGAPAGKPSAGRGAASGKAPAGRGTAGDKAPAGRGTAGDKAPVGRGAPAGKPQAGRGGPDKGPRGRNGPAPSGRSGPKGPPRGR